MADIRELMSRLNGGRSEDQSPAAAATLQTSANNYVSSPTANSSQTNPSAPVLSPSPPSLSSPPQDMTASGQLRSTPDLLSLLNFRQPAQAPSSPPVQPTLSRTESIPKDNRPVSVGDLVAGLTRKPNSIGSVQSPTVLAPSASRPELRGEAASSSANSQDLLLKLLHQSKVETPQKKPERSEGTSDVTVTPKSLAPHATSPGQLAESKASASAEPAQSSVKAVSESFTNNQSSGRTVTEVARPKSHPFTYSNPFEQLSASSPLNRTPKPESQTHAPKVGAPKAETPKQWKETVENSQIPATPSKSNERQPPAQPPATPAASSPRPKAKGKVAAKEPPKDVDESGVPAEKQVPKSPKPSIPVKTNGNTSSTPVKILSKGPSKKEVKPEGFGPTPTPTPTAAAAAAHTVLAPSSSPAKDKASVPVYALPMQPFISIDIHEPETASIEDFGSHLSPISRLKRPFDQVDRNLVSASNNFIVYSLRNSGYKVIRQADGDHAEYHKDRQERVFNVSLSSTKKQSSQGPDSEALMAAGVNGTVFWAPLPKAYSEHTDQSLGSDPGFLIPPFPATDENTSGGQLKTRVKPSTKKPQYFAYGRGKSIYIIWPHTARQFVDPKTRICDTAKYLSEDCLKISTGKAAKDFAFSADDCVIVSLDKAGKLKFWDVRGLTLYDGPIMERAAKKQEVSKPIMTLSTVVGGERCWPTSVMFFDKEKPMHKGATLRFLIVGMKQNHTLQLWDLGLKKPVQEINFPHQDESDAICSLAYHPRTGILTVGHPTRNSIYFLHMSLPIYPSETPANEAAYLRTIANNEKVKEPQSTVIVDSICEYSFGPSIELRSLEILQEPVTPSREDADAAMFTIYVMHSKGVDCLAVHRKELGWALGGNSLGVQKISALDEDVITVKRLAQPNQDPSQDKSNSIKEPAPAPSAQVKEENSSASKVTDQTSPQKQDLPKSFQQTERTEKRKKKKSGLVDASEVTESNSSPVPKRTLKETSVGKALEMAEPTATQSATMISSNLQRSEQNFISEVSRVVASEVEGLYRRIAEDKRVSDASNLAKQEALLRLVSQTLSQNVEPSLQRAIKDQFSNVFTEPMTKNIRAAVDDACDRSLTTAFANAVKVVLPRELEKINVNIASEVGKSNAGLVEKVSNTMMDPQYLRTLSENFSVRLSQFFANFWKEKNGEFLSQVTEIMDDKQAKSYAMLTDMFEKTAADHKRLLAYITTLEDERAASHAKIESLEKTMGTMMQLVQAIARNQVDFRDDMRAAFTAKGDTSLVPQASPAASQSQALVPQQQHHFSPPPVASQQQQHDPVLVSEFNEAKQLLMGHDYEKAMMTWLRSQFQGELFNALFFRVSPTVLNELPQIFVLSVAAAVTLDLNTNLPERLEWLKHVLSLLQPRHTDIVRVVPNVMNTIIERLHDKYAELHARSGASDPILPALVTMNQLVQQALSEVPPLSETPVQGSA